MQRLKISCRPKHKFNVKRSLGVVELLQGISLLFMYLRLSARRYLGNGKQDSQFLKSELGDKLKQRLNSQRKRPDAETCCHGAAIRSVDCASAKVA